MQTKPQTAFDWAVISAMKAEEKEKARRLASEAVKAARAKIEAKLQEGKNG